MRCDEFQEQIVDLLYDSEGTPSADFADHLRTCSACRRELEELKQTREYLHDWKDESPLRSVPLARQEAFLKKRNRGTYLRYAAVAAMVLFCFLALANTEVTWNNSGFSFRTSFLGHTSRQRDYYTKSEVRDIMKRALDDSEFRANEVSSVLMQEVLDTVERDQWRNLRLGARGRTARSENRN
jgi:hypothetical protein